MPQPFHLLPKTMTSMAEEWLDIGLQHHVAGKYFDAEVAYSKGLRADPNNGPIQNNLGVLAAQQDRINLAVQRLERGTMFDKDNATLWYNYALSLLEAERCDEAVKAIEKSLSIMESAPAHTAHGMILTSLTLAEEAAVAYKKALDRDPVHPLASFNSVFVRTLKHTTPEEALEARKFWYKNHGFKGEKKPHDNDKTPDRPLRIGYLCGDFKMHSASFVWRTALLNHDRTQFEPFCYMTMAADPKADPTSQLFMDCANWRDVSQMSDEQMDAQIRNDKIDILVELAGHTGGNKLTVFTRKPAPVQVHAWGFAHGSGCPEIDYFFADPYSIPENERKYFVEKIWDLPAIVGFTPPADYNLKGVSEAPVKRDGTFTFGVFGRFEKYSPQSVDAWRKILLRTPNSRLLIKDRMLRAPYAVRKILEGMKDIDQNRIAFATDCSHPDHMLGYQNVDLVLDTFPHTGGVTALEILYMGVPVITLYNEQVGGRTTSVALKAMGRNNWIANSVKEYINKAVSLASERSELSEARIKLRQELVKSPICEGYSVAVERAYRQMWWKYCGKTNEQVAAA